MDVKWLTLFLVVGFITASTTSSSVNLEWTKDLMKSESNVDTPFVKCMVKCMTNSLATEIRRLVDTCQDDPVCWSGQGALRARTCDTQCELLRHPLQDKDFTLYQLDTPTVGSNRFLKCMGKCLGMDVSKIFEECGKDVNCWLKKLGKEGFECALKCIKWEYTQDYPTVQQVQLSEAKIHVSKRFIKCMGKCLGKDVSKIAEECGKNKKCWLKKGGIQAAQCLLSCIKWEDEQDMEMMYPDVEWSEIESVFKDIEVETSQFVVCWSTCLEKSLAEVGKWAAECHANIQCWLEKAGEDALVCAGKCVQSSVLFKDTQILPTNQLKFIPANRENDKL